MNDIIPRKIKTGGDPRTLPDYTALRDEMGKLSHPARPDVNWQYAEKRCLSLFEQNGVELKTAAWFTLVRMHMAGLSGLNEGLALVESLISYQWRSFWPQSEHARLQILSSLSQHLQPCIRSLPPDYSDLCQLNRAEQLLTSMGEMLQRLVPQPFSELDTLRTLIHNSVVRLESRSGTINNQSDFHSDTVLPACVTHGSTVSAGALAVSPSEKRPDSTVMRFSVAPPEYRGPAEGQMVMSPPLKMWRSFAAGMCTMLIINAIAVWSWQYYHRTDRLQRQFAASLAPFPVPLSSENTDLLRQHILSPKTVITQTQQQLSRLDELPPDWNITYSRQLVDQASKLWPELAEPVALRWQQQLNATALPTERLNGWHQGMMMLQKLSESLNRLDEQKGKYLTVSELKSVVFSTMQLFNQSLPAEEQLRILSQNPQGQPLPVAARAQLEMHLKQLAARYAEIKQKTAE